MSDGQSVENPGYETDFSISAEESDVEPSFSIFRPDRNNSSFSVSESEDSEFDNKELRTVNKEDDGTAEPELKKQKKMNKWEKARLQLDFLLFPDSPLLCRENEHNMILQHLSTMIKPLGTLQVSTGGVLFVAGVPGTGKTATVRIVVSQLKTKYHFDFVEVNAMKLSNPRMVFSWLLWMLQDVESQNNQKTIVKSPEKAQAILDDFFKNGKSLSGQLNNQSSNASKPNKKRKPLLLLLDELEMLMTKDQQILYTFFEWARSPNSQLTIVGIANMLDLPERVHQKINSRMGINKVIFNPYQPLQLQQILLQKMQNHTKLFEDTNVINYIARKVGSSKGDARLTFEVCRRALLFAETDERLHAENQKKEEFELDSSQLSIGDSMEGIEEFEENRPQAPLSPADNTEEVTFKVTIQHVDRVMLSMRDNARAVALKNCSLHEKLWVLAVLSELGLRRQVRAQISEEQLSRISKAAQAALEDDVTFFDVSLSRYEDICTSYGIVPQSPSAMQKISHNVIQLGIFNTNWKDKSLQRAIYMKFNPDDILDTLWSSCKLMRNIITGNAIAGLFDWNHSSA